MDKFLKVIPDLLEEYLKVQGENRSLKANESALVDSTRELLRERDNLNENVGKLSEELKTLRIVKGDLNERNEWQTKEIERLRVIESESYEHHVKLHKLLYGDGSPSSRPSMAEILVGLNMHRDYMEREHALPTNAALWFIEPNITAKHDPQPADYRTEKAKAGGLNPHDAQLLQLMTGPKKNADLLSNSVLDELINDGRVRMAYGYSFISVAGIRDLQDSGLI